MDIILLTLRVLLGVFFVLARGRWLYDPSRTPHWCNQGRHQHLKEKMVYCGYSPDLAAPLAVVEILAGAALIVGVLSQLAAIGLVCVLIGATLCTAKEKVAKQGPVDKIDWVSDYLWTVEPLYLSMALLLAVFGPGQYSFDKLVLFPLLGW